MYKCLWQKRRRTQNNLLKKPRWLILVSRLLLELKLKYLSEKRNEYGTNHFLAVLDESALKELIQLEDMKNLFGSTVVKYYFKINSIKVKELPFETCFKKDNPYIIDLTFSKYDFQKGGEQITGYSISEIKKILNTKI